MLKYLLNSINFTTCCANINILYLFHVVANSVITFSIENFLKLIHNFTCTHQQTKTHWSEIIIDSSWHSNQWCIEIRNCTISFKTKDKYSRNINYTLNHFICHLFLLKFFLCPYLYSIFATFSIYSIYIYATNSIYYIYAVCYCCHITCTWGKGKCNETSKRL